MRRLDDQMRRRAAREAKIVLSARATLDDWDLADSPESGFQMTLKAEDMALDLLEVQLFLEELAGGVETVGA